MNTNSPHLTRKRLLIATVSIALLFCFLAGRMCYLQLIASEGLTVRAAEQWYRDLPLKAKRGAIYDRNGEIIADSRDVFTVYVRPRAVTDVNAVADALSDALGVERGKLIEKIKSAKVGEITVKKGVDFAVGAALRDKNLDGVYFSVDAARSYPHSTYLTQVLGYTNIDNEGQNGLEGYYDKILRGVDGVQLTSTDNKGVEIEGTTAMYVPAIEGASLTTTLDVNIQGFAENAVRNAQAEWKCKSASMIVMDVTSGGILAMAHTPSYDLTDIPREDVDMLNAYSKNTMIVDVYEPGSTFKIFTTAAAQDAGVVNDDNRFYCNGGKVVDGKRIRCWRSIGHGSQNLAEGVKNSCNCVFMDLALRLGTDRLYEYLGEFGFGKKTGVDFFSESRGLLMNPKSVKTVDLARIGFGQAVAVTPLQLISGVCTVVSGEYNQPHFVTRATDTMGNVIYAHEQPAKRVVSEEVSKKMRTLLEGVVAEGSGKKAGVPGYRIGGKTGTAQKYENGAIAQGKYISSFVGFAPADAPRYAALMIVNEPAPGPYYGSLVAAPYVGDVFQRIFDYVGMRPTQDDTVESKGEMPYLIGEDVSAAAALLKKSKITFEIEGTGATVTSTYPIAGSEITSQDVVLLRTDGDII